MTSSPLRIWRKTENSHHIQGDSSFHGDRGEWKDVHVYNTTYNASSMCRIGQNSTACYVCKLICGIFSWCSTFCKSCIPRWQPNQVTKLWSHHDYRVPSTVPLFNILKELCNQRGVLAGSCADPSPTHCVHQSRVVQWEGENGTHTSRVWRAHTK